MKADKAPPMVPGDAAGDREYMEGQGVEKAIALALAQVVREKPTNALRRIAELISPETYVDAASNPAELAASGDPVAGSATSESRAAESEAVPA